MKPEYAKPSYDAIAKTRHPRTDYRTAEAQRYCEMWRPFLETVVTPGCRALDLGCGAGKYTFELERLGAAAVGIDCSKEMIRLAKKVAEDIGSKAEFYVGLFEYLPFRENSFDLIWFPHNIIECSYDEMEVIARQVASLLRPHGRFCLTMHDGIERIRAGRGKGAFDLLTGSQMTSVRISGDEEHPYEATFWTVAYARYLVSRYLPFDGLVTLEGRNHILQFRKHDGAIAARQGKVSG